MPSSTTTDIPTPSAPGGGGASLRLSAMSSKQLWRPSTPEALRAGWKASPATDGWQALREVLAAAGETLATLETSRPDDALLWGIGEDLRSFADWRAATLRLISGGAKSKNTNSRASSNGRANASRTKLHAAIDAWCEASEQAPVCTRFAFEALTWAYALPAVAQRVDSETWWRLAERLDAAATQAGDNHWGDDAPCLDMLNDQLLAGELALVLTTVLPHARPWRTLGKQATESLTEGVLAWTDGEGLPPGRGMGCCLGMLAGCWTRCRRLCYQTGARCWDAAAQTQYEWFVRQLVRLTDRDGSLPLASEPITKNAGLVLGALECAGDESDFAAAALRLGGKGLASKSKASNKKRGKRAGTVPSDVEPPDASVNSEWSGVSLLSAGWGKKQARLLVTYDEQASRISLSNLGVTLLNGVWQTTLRINGQSVAIDGPWEEECWFSDEDCDYLEIAAPLAGGGKIERVVLLAKEDQAAMLVDLIHAGDRQSPVTIEVDTCLPLVEGVRFDPTEETREGWLTNDQRQLAGVVPPSLAEWRVDPRGGELTEVDGSLVLSQQTVGSAVASPVWFDLKPKRFAKQRTWRQLTIAESLNPVARDVAVGYRIQSGKDQWLLYRSLAAKANRTVMGQNYSSESFFGRFDPQTGLADEYFEVEA